MSYKKHQCENSMKWLRKAEMVTTVKTTRGIVVTICNYDHYQNPANYEKPTNADSEATIKPQPLATINKNGKNGKKKELTFFSADTLAGSSLGTHEQAIATALVARFGGRIEQLYADTVLKLIHNLASPVYAGVDVVQEIQRAGIWEDANPTRRKTARGIPKFLTGWMERTQNSGPRGGRGGTYESNRTLLDQWEQEENERETDG